MADQVDPVASGIAVGADGSDHGRAALKWAAHAAVAYGLPLTVLHAAPDAQGEPTVVEDPKGVLGEAVELARSCEPSLEVRALQMPEAPVQSLLTASHSAEVLVLGSRGLEGFQGLLLGSTTRQVAPHAKCPVVVVQSGSEGGRPAITDEDSIGNPGQVVLGYDGSPGTNRATAFAFRHAEATGCGVVAVNVEPSRGAPKTETIDPENDVPGSETSALHSPLIVTASSFPGVPVSFVEGTGRPAEVLLREAIGAELLVVCSRGAGALIGLLGGSVTQKVLAHASCPVAVLNSGIPAATAAGLGSPADTDPVD